MTNLIPNDESKTVYFAGAGDDDNNGLTATFAKKTLAAARTVAIALLPTISNRVAITSQTSDSLNESLVLVDGLNINAPQLTLSATTGTVLTVASLIKAEIFLIGNTGANGIGISIPATIGTDTEVSFLSMTTGANQIGVSLSGAIDFSFVQILEIFTSGVDAIGVEFTATSNLGGNIVEVQNIQINGTGGRGVVYNTTDDTPAVIDVNSITGSSTGGIAIDILDGVVTMEVNEIDVGTQTAIHVASGATLSIFDAIITGDITIDAGGILNCSILEHTGTLTNNGSILGNIANVDFGDRTIIGNLTVQGSILDISSVTSGTSAAQNFNILDGVGGKITLQTDPAVTDYSVFFPPAAAGGSGFVWTIDAAGNLDFVDPTTLPDDTIYNTNGTLTGNRTLTANTNDTFNISSFDTTIADFLARCSFTIGADFLEFSINVGNGSGGTVSGKSIVLTPGAMTITDSTSTKGLEYAADYSPNFTAQSLVDKAFSDANNIYGTDGTITPDATERAIFGNNASALGVFIHDLTGADFLAQARSEWHQDRTELAFDIGNGSGGIATTMQLKFSATDMTVTDSTNTKGLVYAIDYRSNQTARSLTDKEFTQIPATDTLKIRELADLPAPVSNEIIFANAVSLVFETLVDIGDNTLVFQDFASLSGLGDATTGVTSSAAAGTIKLDGPSVITNGMITINSNAAFIAIVLDDATGTWFSTNGTYLGDVHLTAFTLFDGIGMFYLGNIILNGDNPFGELLSSAVSFVDAGIVIEGTNTVGVLRINAAVSDTVPLITLQDPNAIANGFIGNHTFLDSDEVFQCLPVESSSFTPASSFAVLGMDYDGTNLLIADNVAQDVVQYVGLTSTENARFNFPGVVMTCITFARGNLIIGDNAANTITEYVGFTTSQVQSFASPAGDVRGLSYDGTNLISADSTTDLVYIHDGISATIQTTFATGAASTTGVAFDGVNILTVSNADGRTYVHKGKSAEIQYNFFGPGSGNTYGIVCIESGIASSKGDIFIYDNPVTFDQTSHNWEMVKNSGGIQDSANRGGVQYDNLNCPVITITQNVWRTVDDGGTAINYSNISEREKCLMIDDLTGEVIWKGGRETSQTLTVEMVITRTGGGAVDIFFEVAFAINGIPITDGLGRGILPGNNSFVTIISLPITRMLSKDDLITPIIRNITNAQDPGVCSVRMSIT